ncbi:hypothetical protein F5B18DRAFT_667341 [Nemania serpens]|nr:hypothetical protein F5B18DRAFT_667341 [Nemania serpens]
MPASPRGVAPVISPPPAVTRDEGGENETIARLHYRRSKNPRFAELECVVPLDSAVYVSIHDPLHAPAFRPCPAKPLPDWMRLLPERSCRDEARPRSILDAHFPPASSVARPGGGSPCPCPSPRVEELGRDERTGTGTGTEMLCPRAHPLPSAIRSLFPINSPPPQLQPQNRQRPTTSYESISSQSSERLGSAESIGENDRSASPPIFRFPASASPPPYKRLSAVVDEPVKQPSPRLTRLAGEARDEFSSGAGATGTKPSNNLNADKVKRETRPSSQLVLEGKMKSVAWDKNVARGESESGSGSASARESSCDDDRCILRLREHEREHMGLRRAQSPQTPPKRRQSPLSAVWNRVVRPRTPPAQSKEFIELHSVEKPATARMAVASMAVPGRRRGKEVGCARACSKCGNVSD